MGGGGELSAWNGLVGLLSNYMRFFFIHVFFIYFFVHLICICLGPSLDEKLVSTCSAACGESPV